MPSPTLQRIRVVAKRLRVDARGGLAVEYLVVTALGLAVAAGLAALGVAMVDGYGASLQLLYSEFP